LLALMHQLEHCLLNCHFVLLAVPQAMYAMTVMTQPKHACQHLTAVAVTSHMVSQTQECM